jgi:signal transduction histidine kinase
MKPEHAKKLFQKFYRVPGSEKVATGTGLGLSISKKIVDAHGGSIEVNSAENVGTTFTINLPIEG